MVHEDEMADMSKFNRPTRLLFIMLGVWLCTSAFAGAALIPKDQPTREWVQFQSPGYADQIGGVIFDQDYQPECGQILGGISTGGLDFEVSGTIGFDTLFQGYPRKLQRFKPFLGLAIEGQTWVLASSEIIQGGIKRGANDPARDPYTGFRQWNVALPGIEGVKSATGIRYSARYPVVDYDFQTDAPVDVDARIWAPFVPGSVESSSIPAIVFEIYLKNKSNETRRGRIALNYPGVQSTTEIGSQYTDAGNLGDIVFARGKAPFDGDLSGETEPSIAREIPARGPGGRMAIGDSSGDGQPEVVLGLCGQATGRGFLVAWQRTEPAAMDGDGQYRWDVVDILEDEGFTVTEFADLEGDGQLEIVAGTSRGRLFAYTFHGSPVDSDNPEPLAHYTRRQLNAAQGSAGAITDVCPYDLDGDGATEIIYTLGYQTDETQTTPGAYLVDFGKVTPLLVDPLACFTACAVGDFDGDGADEAAVAATGDAPQGNFVCVLQLRHGHEAGAETFLELPPGEGPDWLAAGDFNGNGTDDLLVGTPTQGTIWFERLPSGTGNSEPWQRETAFAHAFTASSRPAELIQGDPKTYIVVGDRNTGLLGRLDGPDVPPGQGQWGLKRYMLDTGQAVALGDLSGDHIPDILSWHPEGRLNGITVLESTQPFFHNHPRTKAQGRRGMSAPSATVVALPHGEEYALAVLGDENVHFGGNLSQRAGGWADLSKNVPPPDKTETGASASVDFELAPLESRTIRYALAWYVPQWRSTFTYTRQNIIRYRNADDIVSSINDNHAQLLNRIYRWQDVVYQEPNLPLWLKDSMINSLGLIAEDSYWAVAQPPLGDWCFPDGLYGMIESPRAAPQIECIPCTWYGNIPLVYFFPNLTRSTLRGFKEYQRAEDGAMVFNFGARDEMWWYGDRALENQIALNGFCFVDMVHRQWRCTGDDTVVEEFYPAVRAATIFAQNIRPEVYGMLHMPTFGSATEWWEGWAWEGLTTHAGSLNLTGLLMAERMAEHVGDKPFAVQCRTWFKQARDVMEGEMWLGDTYALFKNMETGKTADDIMSNQFDAEWVSQYGGVESVFDKPRLDRALDRIWESCVVQTGAAAFATKDGEPLMRAYGNFIPEMMILGMTYLYTDQPERGLEIVRRMFDNLYFDQPYVFDWPNWIYMDTGKRAYGSDYYQNMLVWAIPAAINKQAIDEVRQQGSLVNRIILAGSPPQRLKLDSAPIVRGLFDQVVPDYVPPTTGEITDWGEEPKP